MAARQPAPPSASTVPLILGVAAAIAAALTWFGYPGLILAAPALAFAAISAPPALLTGKRNSAGAPTPASPGEAKAFHRYQMWNELRLRSVVPSGDWLPGWPMRLWWFTALAAGFLAAAIPAPALDAAWRIGAGLSVFAAIVALNGALRRWTAPDDPCPGPTADVLAGQLRTPAGVAVIASAGIGGAAAFLAVLITLDRLGLAATIAPAQPWMVAAAAAVLVASATLALGVRGAALERWRTMVRIRAEWEPRWQITKLDPAPRLVDHTEVGNIQVDTFDAHPSIGSAAIYPLIIKINAALGSGSRAAILEAPDVDSQNQPIPGTKSGTRFRIATFVGDAMPDVTSVDTDPAEAQLRIAAAFSWMSDSNGYGRWIIGDVVPLHEEGNPESTAAWQVEFHAPDGPSAKDMRLGPMGTVGAFAEAEVLIDHRGAGDLFIGALTGDTTAFAHPAAAKTMEELALTDTWNERWTNILKLGAVRPRPEHAVYAEATCGRSTLYRQPFVVQQGLDPLEFFKLEPKIATTLNAAPFVSVTGFAGQGDRPGERHGQAFVVTWSATPVPSNPDKLEPQPGEGPKWVLAGRINAAFDVARLARPEVIAVKPLTAKDSRGGHIWEIRLRLHGGVTLAEVRTAAQRIRQALGSEWLRVGVKNDTVVIVAGVDAKTARNVRFAQPEKTHRDYITSLDWEQAFSDAKVIGQGGMLPTLTRSDVLPNNDQVQVLDFKLPTGTSRALVKEAVSKLSTTTGNSFVDVRESPDGADSVRLLVSRDNPLPDRAGFQWETIDAAEGIPFATGIEGEPIEFDPTANPHALLGGVTGSGKSILAQVFMYGALVKGCELYIIDPVKGGADFQFAKDHARAIASTPAEAQAVMKAVYAEVVRRKNMNAAAGVGSIADLPDPPPRIFVMIDEFTSLMGQDQVPPPTDDPAAELEREEIIANNRAKTDVGVYAGKIAREARSAGVHLLLGTQKLAAKMLDTIPGASDLKDLSLDTRIPVPISERFPDGWARNDELVEGDTIYTPFGTTTTVEGFSEVFTDNDVYAVTFDDGQVVKAGAGHWWQVSDEASRRAHGRADGPDCSGKARRAAAASLLADTMTGNEYMTVDEIASELGCGPQVVIAAAEAANIPRLMVDRLSGELAPYVRERGAAPVAYSVDEVLLVLGEGRWPLDKLAEFQGRTLTCREMMRVMTGVEPSPSQAGNLGTALRLAGLVGVPTERAAWVHNALSLLRAIAVQTADGRAIDERGELIPLERVLTTAELAEKVFTNRGDRNFGVRQAAAVPGEHADLPIDPYVLGAWLGDGSSGSGYVVASDVGSCTDEFGLTDKAHMVEQLTAAGYNGRSIACSPILIGTSGLRAKLRHLGVLRKKHIPSAYLRASVDQRLALLQGLMDTDGTVTVNGQLVISQTNHVLAGQIRELVQSLGIRASWNASEVGYVPKGETVKKMTSTSYSVSFRTETPVFRLPRKVARQAERSRAPRSPWRYIASVEKLESQPTRCIRVADSRHLFLVEGFLPTHNTNLARVLLGKASSGDRMSALRAFQDAPELTGDIPKGRGLYEPLTSSAVAAQVWFAPQADLREQLLARRAPLAVEDRLDVAALLPKRPDETAGAIRHFSSAPSAVEVPAEVEPEEVELDALELVLDFDDEDGDDVDISAEIETNIAADVEISINANVDMIVEEKSMLMNKLMIVDGSWAAPAGALHLPAADPGVVGDTGWWKLDWALTALGDATAVEWCGPDLLDEDEIGVQHFELVEDALSAAGVEVTFRHEPPAVGDTPAPAAAPAVELAPAPAPAPLLAAPAPALPVAQTPVVDSAPAAPAVAVTVAHAAIAEQFGGDQARVVALRDEFPDAAPAQRPGTVFDNLF